MRNSVFLVVIFFFVVGTSAQETDSLFYLQQPKQIDMLQLQKALDSLALKQLNDKYFSNKMNQFIEHDTLTAKQLDSITLRQKLGSYEDFKRKFLALQLQPECPNLHLNPFSRYNSRLDDADFEGQAGFSASGPISALYNAFSKEGKFLRRYVAVKQSQPRQRIINTKYNTQKVQYVTGLKGDSLTKFVLFCHFDNEYLLNVPEYELIDTIFKKLIEFKAKEDSSNYSN